MGSPSYWGKLAAFEASFRKPALVAFGLFNAQDNLGFIADIPGAGTSLSVASVAYSSSLAVDTSTADVLSVLLTGDATLTINYGGSSNIPSGKRNWIRLVQDATGNRAVTLPASLYVDPQFAIDPVAGRATVLPIQWNGTHWIFFSQPFSVPTA